MNSFSLFNIGNITKLLPGGDEACKSQTFRKKYSRGALEQVNKMLFCLPGCYCDIFLIFQLFEIGIWA